MRQRTVVVLVLFFVFTPGLIAARGLKSQTAPCQPCGPLEGFVTPDQIHDDIRKMVGKYNGGGGEENVAVQKERGVIETGLRPVFVNGGRCPGIDSEKWAIDYAMKRSWPALHKGVDIPQPRGTPVRAVSDGTVVGKFENPGNRKGIEIMLRHTPEQTGLPFWIYTQYTHLLEIPPLPIGAQVRMGDEIGRTANTGKAGKKLRRDALHFAVMYSTSPLWSNDGDVVTPKDGFFMDPNAFYRLSPPWDSASVKALADKQVAVPYMDQSGRAFPPGTQRIWPYRCP